MNEELIEEGIVLKSENGFTEIALSKNTNCKDCSAKLFCKPSEDSSRIIKVKDSNKFNSGDKISVSISGKTLLKASLQLYFYPLVLFIGTILLGLTIFPNSKFNEVYSFLLSCTLVSIYYFMFFSFSKKLNNNEPQIHLTKIN